jgi:hypothetical protein
MPDQPSKESEMSGMNNMNDRDEWMIWDDETEQDEARWMKEVNQEEWEREMQKIEKMLEEVWG